MLALPEGAGGQSAATAAPDSVQAAGRIAYLESIRGLASLQVLLLHTFSAFAPILVFSEAPSSLAGAVRFSPLFLFYDGLFAVYVFFTLSGFVLTPAFARWADRPFALATSRWLRLAIPALVAVTIAMAIKLLVGAAPAEAARAIGLDWFVKAWSPPRAPTYFFFDALVQGLWAGYSNTSILPDLGLPLVIQPVTASYLPPLWTLSVEMQGSLLIATLVVAARRSRLLWTVLFALCLVFLLRTYFLCFLIGHVLARFDARTLLRRTPAGLLFALAMIGLCLSLADEYGAVAALASCERQRALWTPCTPHLLKMVGAVLTLVAALGASGLEAMLTRRPFVSLGRLSFSLYLIHWPIVCGVCAALFLAIGGGEDSSWARAAAMAAAIVLSLVGAGLFSRIDAWAIAASRRLRSDLAQPERRLTPPAAAAPR